MRAWAGSLFVLLLVLPLVVAAKAGETGYKDGVPRPTLAKAAGGGECVADTDYMRRFHMLELRHQRDKTMHEGIRTKRFSLQGCIDCHAVKGAGGEPVSIKSEQHFCRSCHDYAAVTMDCFSCHNSKPDKPSPHAELPDPGKRRDFVAVDQYLGRKRQ
jgi:hypothetical protein